jgi:hypothetical protein
MAPAITEGNYDNDEFEANRSISKGSMKNAYEEAKTDLGFVQPNITGGNESVLASSANNMKGSA